MAEEREQPMAMTAGEQKALKNLCDHITALLETKQGKEIVFRAADCLRNGLIDKFHLITEQSVKEVLVLHFATLPVFVALFGERSQYNPITMVLDAALSEILDIKTGGES